MQVNHEDLLPGDLIIGFIGLLSGKFIPLPFGESILVIQRVRHPNLPITKLLFLRGDKMVFEHFYSPSYTVLRVRDNGTKM